MVYSPQLSLKAAVTLRRLSWLRSEPMTATIEEIIKTIAEEIENIKPGAICGACRDKDRCSMCFINDSKTESGRDES